MEKYILQKAQKIVSALYLVTDFIKDSDSLKWEIREEGISFVSNALLFGSDIPMEKDSAFHALSVSSNKIISFINIALTSALISHMNGSIIINEIESIISFARKNCDKEKVLPGYILSDSFFATDTALPSPSDSRSTLKTVNTAQNKPIMIKDKKDNRQESILALLKKDSNLTIKDFSSVIKDCSEKTIQRELSLLVEKGLVKKVGERRWSKYSLV